MNIRWNPVRGEWQFWAYDGEPRACWAYLESFGEDEVDEAVADAEDAFGREVIVDEYDETAGEPEDPGYAEEALAAG